MEKNQSDPSARAHAKLSASQTKRWMTCPGSMRLIDDLPPAWKPKQSQFAALGTAAHTLGEVCLAARRPDSRDYLGWWIHCTGEMQKRTPDPIEVERGEWFEVDHDMTDAVDTYLRVVYEEVERLGPAAELSIERKFDLSWVRPDMFGTNDASISLFMDELVVIDYKHGQGVPVEVSYFDEKLGKEVGNSQLAYYGLGAAKAFDFTHEKITLIVVQPRCPHPKGGVRRFTMTMAELLEFRDRLAVAADKVIEAYNAWDELPCIERSDASAGQKELFAGLIPSPQAQADWEAKYLKAGDHCKSAFCSKLATCNAVTRIAQDEAMADFADDPVEGVMLPVPQGVEAIAQALKWIPLLDARNKAINELAQRLAEQGIQVPGQKLVRKKANRKWVCTDGEVVTLLTNAGLSPKDFLSAPELRSPAQVEKIGPEAKKLVNGHKLKNDENWIVAPLAEKGVGGLTLAPVTDPREEVVIDPSADFPQDEFPEVEFGEGDA